MGLVDWGIDADVIDGFDREKQEQYKPYTGPKPPNGVYKWRIDQMLVKDPEEGRYPQWLALLVLVPRDSSERRYKGYKVWFSASVGPKNAFAYVPMMDVLGVSTREFLRKCRTTDEGKVKSIGAWRMDGKQELLAEIRDNYDEEKDKTFINVNWVGPLEDDDSDEDEDDYEDEDYDDEDED